MDLLALRCVKGGAKTMWTLITLEKYEGTIDDVNTMRGYKTRQKAQN